MVVFCKFSAQYNKMSALGYNFDNSCELLKYVRQEKFIVLKGNFFTHNLLFVHFVLILLQMHFMSVLSNLHYPCLEYALQVNLSYITTHFSLSAIFSAT